MTPAPVPIHTSMLGAPWGRRCSLLRAGSTVLLGVLLAVTARGQSAPADEDIEAGRRFMADYRPFLTSPNPDPARVTRLANDLAAVVRVQQRDADSAWVAALDMVALRLVECSGEACSAVLDQADALRSLTAAHGTPALGVAVDESLALALLSRGDWLSADQVLDAALSSWPGPPPQLLVLRADLRRKQESWEPAREDLDRVDTLLATADADLAPVRCAAAGVRAQLELSLGRLDHADLALGRAEAALQVLVNLRPPSDPELLGLVAATVVRRAELDAEAGRYALVAQNLAALLEAPSLPPHLALTLRLQHAVALNELERLDPQRERLSQDLLTALAQDDRLPAVQRAAVILCLAEMALRVKAPEEAATRLDQAAELLAHWQDPASESSDHIELHTLAVLKARLARLRGDSDETLAQHLDDLVGALDTMLASWAATPILPGGLGFLHVGARRELLVELIALRHHLHGQAGLEASVVDVARAQAMGSASRRLGLAAPDLHQLRRELLAEDGLLLLYVPAYREGVLLAVDGTTVRRFPLAEAPAIEALADRCRIESDPGEAQALLVRALLPDGLAGELQERSHVVLSGLSWLRDVPFATLPLRDLDDLGNLGEPGQGRSLGSLVALSHLPSLPLAVHLAQQWPEPAQDTAGSLALWVAPDPAPSVSERWPGLRPFDIDQTDLDALTAGFDPALVDMGVTAQTLLSGPLGDTRVLHLMSHGAWDALAERPAALVLTPQGDGDDGLLGCDQVEQPLRPYPTVVVLSACGAAQGQRRLGEDGVGHLGGGFLAGGAQAVLLAHGDLELAQMIVFTSRFQDELARGATPAEALRRARQAHGTTLPLRLLGIGHKPLFVATSPAWRSPAALLGLAVALALAAHFWRRRSADR